MTTVAVRIRRRSRLRFEAAARRKGATLTEEVRRRLERAAAALPDAEEPR